MKTKMDTERENPDKVLIRARAVWTSPDGMFVIVKAVFPENLIRSLTSRTLSGAKMPGKYKEVTMRHGTTEAAYALVPARYVMSDGNEFGEVAP